MAAPNVYIARLARKLKAGGSETEVFVDRLETVTGEKISTSNFALFSRGVLTVNPDGDGSSSFPEYIAFTGVEESPMRFTNITRGLSAVDNSEVEANKRFFSAGTRVAITFGVHNLLDVVNFVNNEIGSLTVGASTNVAGTAGETLEAGDSVYLEDDGKWWKTNASDIDTIRFVQIGIAQGAVVADGAITNGVLRKGTDGNQSGLTVGAKYYLSDTPGEISTTPGTIEVVVGVARAADNLYFDPDYQSNNFIPSQAGIVLPYAGTTSPNGFLLCDGAAVSRTAYPQLFSVVGTSYGAGDGSTTFNVPDLRAKIPVGLQSSDEDFDTVGKTGGEKDHLLTEDEMPKHRHENLSRVFSGGNSSTTSTVWDGKEGFGSASIDYPDELRGVQGMSDKGDDQPHNNMQPYVVMNYIIKT